MDKYKITISTWNKIAALYEEKFMDISLYNNSYDEFCELVVEAVPVLLEIGCGPGNITKYILNRLPNAKILATDVAPDMLELTKKNNPEVTIKQLDARSVSTLTETFDGIIIGFCIPYIDQEACNLLLKACYSRLHNHGIVYLSFIEGNYNDSGFQKGSTGDQAYVYYYSILQLKQMCLAANFEVLSEKSIAYQKGTGQTENHIVLILKKSN